MRRARRERAAAAAAAAAGRGVRDLQPTAVRAAADRGARCRDRDRGPRPPLTGPVAPTTVGNRGGKNRERAGRGGGVEGGGRGWVWGGRGGGAVGGRGAD